MARAITLSTSSIISRIAVRVVLINAHGGGGGGGGGVIVLLRFVVHELTRFGHQPPFSTYTYDQSIGILAPTVL